ncbi:hypothetical protein Celaphus_00000173 [Cervus elaphus hippelaphus]|uniref:Uncharacterized protein n=1 Tax=Cervus elaphus hippelaphus TaxID=46360 RepID=A0A212D7M6_CEREH|nr:hypothetical protein Celaphus_00000173 [Cervus elaphus hippelaphus]
MWLLARVSAVRAGLTMESAALRRNPAGPGLRGPPDSLPGAC